MKKIEITTTQNVTIEYQLATVIDRAIALFIDQILIWGTIGALMFAFQIIFRIDSNLLFYFIGIPIFFFYTPAFEIFNNGQSPGKLAMKIRVVKLDGSKANVFDYLMRWAFRMIDIYFSLGIIAALSVSSSSKGQRLGDFLAFTTVVKIKDSNRLPLSHILQLDTIRGKDLSYPGVSIFTEHDMLVIKETLERYMKYPSPGHNRALELLLKKIEQETDISPPDDKITFLKRIIREYVALTR